LVKLETSSPSDIPPNSGVPNLSHWTSTNVPVALAFFIMLMNGVDSGSSVEIAEVRSSRFPAVL